MGIIYESKNVANAPSTLYNQLAAMVNEIEYLLYDINISKN